MANEIASSFCPEGYVLTAEAILRAAQFWFPEQCGAAVGAAGFDRRGHQSHDRRNPRSVHPSAMAAISLCV